jgi:oligosaccharide repeat unit polymerase
MFGAKIRDGHTAVAFDYSARGLVLHPLALFVGVWGAVIFLYSLHLSGLLVFTTAHVLGITAWIVVPYAISVIAFQIFYAFAPKRVAASGGQQLVAPDHLERRLVRWFVFWVLCTAIEIKVSGGVPILWLLQGSAKTYMDFGIPSVHGFLNSLLMAIGVGQVGLFALDGKKRHLWIPAWIVLWSAIAVTRNLMIVSIIQSAIVWGVIRGVRKRTLINGIVFLLVLILLFGYMGDFRSGANAFRAAALPTDAFPDWLPSGALWVYIYVATPVGNLVNTAAIVPPQYNLLFPNTVALLLPTVLRKLVYGEAALTDALSGELVTEAFNVSTAYVGPFQDYGRLGMACFSILLGVIAAYYWRKRTFRDALIYGVIGQILVLSIFFNHLFYLPVISQIGWLFVFFPTIAGEQSKSVVKLRNRSWLGLIALRKSDTAV